MKTWMIAGLMVAGAATAQAQFGVYGMGQGLHYTDSGSNLSQWMGGGTAGVYDDFVHVGPVAAGVDLRGSLASGNSYRYRNALAGVRVGVKVPLLPLRPYVQGSVGLGGTRYTGTSAVHGGYSNKFLYEVLGGLDFTLIPHVDVRAVEVGVGRQSPVSGSTNDPGISTVLLGAGIVIRL